MRSFLISLFIGLLAISFLTLNAEARRFGGGKSFGVSRQASSFSKPTPAGYGAATSQQAAKSANGNRWLGPLAGLAAGGLLAALFMGHGFGTGILSWLLLAGVAFFVWQLLKNRLGSHPSQTSHINRQTYHAQPHSQPQQSGFTPVTRAANDMNETQSVHASTSFNEAEFLRAAKSTFIRMQTAYDNKNLSDIREFTSPEVFAEVQLQIQERGSEPNVTEVIEINAELLDLSTSGQTVATVLFTGLIREEKDAEPVAIKEMWHFNKDLFRPVWVVAGIQQA